MIFDPYLTPLRLNTGGRRVRTAVIQTPSGAEFSLFRDADVSRQNFVIQAFCYK
ncbi:hypothetical protein PAMP_009766 [Pampus punctatissimus]